MNASKILENETPKNSDIGNLSRRAFVLKMMSTTLTGSSFLAFLASCEGDKDIAPHFKIPSPTPIHNPKKTSLPIINSKSKLPIENLVEPEPQFSGMSDQSDKLHKDNQVFEVKSGNNEEIRINHLLRRAGFGPNPKEFVYYHKIGLDKTLDSLINFETIDNSALDKRLDKLDLKPTDRIRDLRRWWLLRMIYTQRPLEEKMVLFWHGLLTSGISSVGQASYMYQQNQLFREKGLGSYDTLVKAISKDPAMLIWLDSRKNKKNSPNENFARELMELFTMGEGSFEEKDVKEASRAFTGYFLLNGKFTFKESQHDFGLKYFLDHSGHFSGDEIINVIFQQPQTAEYICRKLFIFFVHDAPDLEFIEDMAKILRSNDYNIKTVVEHLLSSPEFYSQKAYRSKIKSPVDLTVGLLRNTGSETDGRRLSNLVTGMGQSLFDPPDVAGWPEGSAWITSSTMIQRLNFCYLMTISNFRGTNFDPRNSIPSRYSNSLKELLDAYLHTMLDGNVNPNELAIFESYMRRLQKINNGTNTNVYSEKEVLRHLAYLIFASPTYQLS